MAGPWEKYQAKSSKSDGGKPWEKYSTAKEKKFDIPEASEIMKEQFKVSAPEALVLGAGQGLLSNFGDDALALATGNKGKEAAQMFKAVGEQQPVSFGAGKMGGSVAQMALPGAALTKAGLLGAASGLGDSEADTLGGKALDTAVGGVGGLLGQGLSAAGSKGIELARAATGGKVFEPLASGLSRAGSTIVGAGAGALLSDNPEQKLKNALLGGLLGGAQPGLSRRLNPLLSALLKKSGRAADVLIDSGLLGVQKTLPSGLGARLGAETANELIK